MSVQHTLFDLGLSTTTIKILLKNTNVIYFKKEIFRFLKICVTLRHGKKGKVSKKIIYSFV